MKTTVIFGIVILMIISSLSFSSNISKVSGDSSETIYSGNPMPAPDITHVDYYFKDDGTHGWGHQGINTSPPENLGSPTSEIFCVGDDAPQLIEEFYFEDVPNGQYNLGLHEWTFNLDLWEMNANIAGELWAEVKVNGILHYSPTKIPINKSTIITNSAPGTEITWIDGAVSGICDIGAGDNLTVEIWFDSENVDLNETWSTLFFEDWLSTDFSWQGDDDGESLPSMEYWNVDDFPGDNDDIQVGNFGGGDGLVLQFQDTDNGGITRKAIGMCGGANNWFDLTWYVGSPLRLNFTASSSGLDNAADFWEVGVTRDGGFSFIPLVQESGTSANHGWQSYSVNLTSADSSSNQWGLYIGQMSNRNGDYSYFDEIKLEVYLPGGAPPLLVMGYDGLNTGTDSHISIPDWPSFQSSMSDPMSFTVPIYKDWNIISIPIEPLDKGSDNKFTAFDLLREVEEDLGFGIYTLAAYNGGEPARYTIFDFGTPEGAPNDFKMNNVDAYWLYSPGPSGMLNIPGQNISNWGVGNVKTLQPGWNLCGFPHNVSVGGAEPGGWNTRLRAHHFTDGTVDADLKVGVADEEQIIATRWLPAIQQDQSWLVNVSYPGYAPNDWYYNSYYSQGYWLWVNSSITVTFDTEF